MSKFLNRVVSVFERRRWTRNSQMHISFIFSAHYVNMPMQNMDFYTMTFQQYYKGITHEELVYFSIRIHVF